MQVRLNAAKCAGHALCYGVDPDLFPLDDDGYSTLTAQVVAAEDERTIREGVAACPELALALEDD